MTRNTTDRVWLVTGASSGLGLAFTRAALAAGDRVVATARRTSPLDATASEHPGRLVVLPLDVTDREAVRATVDKAAAAFGRLDVVVNNAGIMASGTVEEFTEDDARAQLETNFFGALWVTQAVLPHLRAQQSGHIIQISSIGGVIGFATTGLYSASKWALEGMSEALAQEVAPFGIRVSIVEPGGYTTGLYTAMRTEPRHEAYEPLHAALAEMWGDAEDSDPADAARALLALVDSDEPPLRLVLGGAMYDVAQQAADRRKADWAGWEATSRAAGR
ncbi:SDR family NAD(P)-dependent oxidoreductase [Kitasatospora sp. NPDC058170]|uniref:SDR family NAD(P)-dependent oxidoreductase n=1 Tax=Kitasatospora sp. NPDC058170 TaxID=3346364 RepID=UPI0036D91EA2